MLNRGEAFECEGGEREEAREGRREATHRLLVDVFDAQDEVAEDEGQHNDVEDDKHPPANLHHVLAFAPNGSGHEPEGHDANLRGEGRGGRKRREK